MHLRRPRVLVVAMVAVAMLLSACGSGGSSGGTETLRVAYRGDISSLDPIKGNSGTDHVMLYTIYDTLVSFEEDTLKPKPALAESWDQSDPDKLVLKLRKDVTFHDGTPFNAEAVKFNIERAMGEGSNVKTDIDSVKGVTVVDEFTAQLDLSRPDAGLLLVLADRPGMMVSPAAAGQDDALAKKPVGAGPWAFSEWKRGDSLKVKAYGGYWDKESAIVDGIVFKFLSDPKTRLSSLASGQQDVAMDLAPSEVSKVEKNEKLKLISSPSLWVSEVYINKASPEFEDPRVRRALSVSIDRDEIVKSALFGRATPASSWSPKGHWAEASDSVKFDFDLAEAKSLLEQAGVGDGFAFDMILIADPIQVRQAEIMKETWAKIGIKVNLVPTELVQATTDMFEGKRAPAYLSAWTGRPDPVQTIRAQFYEDGYQNAGKVATPGLLDVVKKSDAAVDQDKRAVLMREADELIYNDVPIIPIVFQDLLVGYSAKLSGMEPNLLGKMKFVGVAIK